MVELNHTVMYSEQPLPGCSSTHSGLALLWSWSLPSRSLWGQSQSPHSAGRGNVAQRWAVTHLGSHSLLMAEETGAPVFHADFSFHHVPLSLSLLEVIPDCHPSSIRNLLSLKLFGSYLSFSLRRAVFTHHWQNGLALNVASVDSCGLFLALPWGLAALSRGQA